MGDSCRRPFFYKLAWNAFVPHWKKLKLVSYPTEQRLWIVESSLGDVNESSHAKTLGEHCVGHGIPALDFNNYIELLISACTTYHKNCVYMKERRNISERLSAMKTTLFLMILISMIDLMRHSKWNSYIGSIGL
jgi:hypothetical protein